LSWISDKDQSIQRTAIGTPTDEYNTWPKDLEDPEYIKMKTPSVAQGLVSDQKQCKSHSNYLKISTYPKDLKLASKEIVCGIGNVVNDKEKDGKKLSVRATNTVHIFGYCSFSAEMEVDENFDFSVSVEDKRYLMSVEKYKEYFGVSNFQKPKWKDNKNNPKNNEGAKKRGNKTKNNQAKPNKANPKDPSLLCVTCEREHHDNPLPIHERKHIVAGAKEKLRERFEKQMQRQSNSQEQRDVDLSDLEKLFSP
jgi:hypothetical protein